MPRRPGGSWPWLAGSMVVHVLLAVGLIYWPDARPRAPVELPPPAFDIVFDGASPERAGGEAPPGEEAPPGPPPGAPPSVAAPPPPDAPTPPVEQPPPTVAAAVPPPVAPPMPSPAPVPAPPQPPAPPPPPPGARPAPAPAAPPAMVEAPRPPVPPPPAPPLRAEAPALPAPPPRPSAPEAPPVTQAFPLPEAEEFLAPPTELRLPQRLAQPLPSAPATPQARPPQRLPGIFLPEGAQLGGPGGAARPPGGRPQGRGLDLSVDPRFAQGDARTDPSVRVEGAQVGANWRAAFRRWLDQNISYPQQAAMRGEDGTVRVRIVANPDGSVRSVRLVLPSTSPSLNYATTFPFQGARLPAFPPPADPNGVTVDLTVNYILRRQ